MRADASVLPNPSFKPFAGFVGVVENGIRKVAHWLSSNVSFLRPASCYVKVIIAGYRGGYYGNGGIGIVGLIVIVLILAALFGHGVYF